MNKSCPKCGKPLESEKIDNDWFEVCYEDKCDYIERVDAEDYALDDHDRHLSENDSCVHASHHIK